MGVRVEKDGSVFTVVLAQAEKRNAVDATTAESLALAFRAFDNDKESKVAVLWGEGGHFCAGADLKALAVGQGNRIDPDGEGPMGPTRMFLSKPVIAAISGFAVAGGLELALWCDLRVVERSAVFGVFCRRFGVPLVDGGTVRLPRIVGISRALDMILTGRPVEAEEALEIGLANRLVDDGTSREAAEELARELASFPQECLRNDRKSVWEGLDLDLEMGLRNELHHGLVTLASGESFDGARRFGQGFGKHGEFPSKKEES